MNKIYFILLATILAISVEGRIFRIIDDFTDTPYLARYTPAPGDVYDNTYPYDWFSPYNADVITPPFTNFRNVANVIGGQRDIIIGHISAMQTQASISCSVNRATGSQPANFQLSLPTNFLGGIYLQYDGIDNGVSAAIGSLLGKNIGGDSGAGSNADGTVDFTFGGAARGIQISVQTDLPIQYELKAVGLTTDTTVQNTGNRLDLLVQRNEITGFTRFYFTYDDLDWSDDLFDWTHVAGFQIKVFTDFGSPTTQSLDSRIFLIQIGTFQVGGTVRADCLCDNLALVALAGIRVNLYDTSVSTTVPLAFTTTDSNGDYFFFDQFTSSSGFIDTTTPYRICLNDNTLVRCAGTLPNTANGCYDFFTTDPFVDLLDFDFTISRTTSIEIPPPRSLECNVDSTLPPNTGFAFVTDCSGTRTQINTWNDGTPTRSNCVTTIRRVWSDPASLQSGTQIITITDTRAPSFSNPPTDSNQSCGTLTTTLSQWVNTNAGAIGTDVCAFSRITNNWNNQQINGCGSATVAFTAVDVCGLTSAPITATYTINSVTGPSFSTQAQNLNVECNFQQASLNPNTQITTWRNNHGNAVATDGCTTQSGLTWTDTFSGTSITSANACTFTETVTFRVTNGCGATSATTAVVSVRDTTAPRISPQASDQTAQCSLTSSNNDAFTAWRNAHGNAAASDDCTTNAASLTWTDNYTGGPISGTCDGTTTVTFSVFDLCAQVSRTTAAFRITDTEAPRLTTPASNRDSPCSASGNVADYNNWVSTHGGAQATDNCGSVSWTHNAPANPPSSCGTPVTVTFTASQLCTPTLSVSTTASFRITDTAAPTFSTPPVSGSSECGPNAPSAFTAWLADDAGAEGTDTCSAVTITNNFVPPNLSNGCNNVATVLFTVRDACGNPSTPATATYTIRDTTNPTITTQASPQTVECNASTNPQAYSSWIANHGGAQATDICFTSLNWSINDTTPIVSSCLTNRYIQFTVSDPCNNRASTISSFTITDSQAPTLTSQARDRSVECTGTDANSDLASWLANNGGATATDNCGAVTWTNTFVALDPSCVSINTVTFIASDSCQRQVSTTATFTYSDTQPPVITRQATATTVECSATNSNAFQTFLDTHGGAQARDACSPASALIWTNSFVSAPQGCSSSIVTFTVTDACGRSASTTTTFAVVDTTRPVFSPPPVDLTIQCDETNQAAYDEWLEDHGGAAVIDECATSITWTHNGTDTAPVGCGRRVVVFTAEDNCNNAVFATATFRVTDTVGPSFISLAQNQTVECDADGNEDQLNNFIATRAGATAIDDCYGTNIIWSNTFGGQLTTTRCSQFATVTFRAADPCGATSSTTATFTIIDTTAPEITKEASAGSFECNDDVNGDQIDQYLLTHGGSSATEICTVVTWTDDFLDSPLECSGPMRVVFTAADVCGNVAQTFGSVEIIDSVKPKFVDFPEDVTLGCDRGTDPEETGIPTGFDACDDEPTISWSDEQIQLPDEYFCPGDIITYRTWTIRDNCGNSDSRQQIITTEFAFTSDPCTPAECPTCRLNVCCPAVIDRVQCNPVPCTPVACTTVGCTTVPCIPNTDCEVIYYPDDDGEPPAPQPSILPAPSCEPVYIYIFDDDGPEDPDVYRAESQNSSSALAVSVFFLLLSLLML